MELMLVKRECGRVFVVLNYFTGITASIFKGGGCPALVEETPALNRPLTMG
jgi:hypothetical protein